MFSLVRGTWVSHIHVGYSATNTVGYNVIHCDLEYCIHWVYNVTYIMKQPYHYPCIAHKLAIPLHTQKFSSVS